MENFSLHTAINKFEFVILFVLYCIKRVYNGRYFAHPFFFGKIKLFLCVQTFFNTRNIMAFHIFHDIKHVHCT